MIDPRHVFRSLSASPVQGPLTVGTTVRTVWNIPHDLPYFNGHFPQSPILPAIAIADASTYYLQQVLAQPEIRIKSIVSAKFLRPILPQQTVALELRRLGEREWQVDWQEEATAQALSTLHFQV
jgi:3-hydroxymyristoyl/3-hydroxydecanoyl-(acyl carrier protein) dehydratase